VILDSWSLTRRSRHVVAAPSFAESKLTAGRQRCSHEESSTRSLASPVGWAGGRTNLGCPAGLLRCTGNPFRYDAIEAPETWGCCREFSASVFRSQVIDRDTPHWRQTSSGSRVPSRCMCTRYRGGERAQYDLSPGLCDEAASRPLPAR
jgi:hypothetical protein